MSFGVRLRITKIKLPVWVKTNGGMIRRYALEPDHPEHPYQWVKREIQVDPEDFGIYKSSKGKT